MPFAGEAGSHADAGEQGEKQDKPWFAKADGPGHTDEKCGGDGGKNEGREPVHIVPPCRTTIRTVVHILFTM